MILFLCSACISQLGDQLLFIPSMCVHFVKLLSFVLFLCHETVVAVAISPGFEDDDDDAGYEANEWGIVPLSFSPSDGFWLTNVSSIMDWL